MQSDWLNIIVMLLGTSNQSASLQCSVIYLHSLYLNPWQPNSFNQTKSNLPNFNKIAAKNIDPLQYAKICFWHRDQIHLSFISKNI